VVTFYLFLLAVAALGAGAYLALFFSHIPGATEERLGEWEALPPHLGEWIEQEERAEDGSLIERRHLLPEGDTTGRKIILQERHRHSETREIVRVLDEKFSRRKRIKR